VVSLGPVSRNVLAKRTHVPSLVSSLIASRTSSRNLQPNPSPRLCYDYNGNSVIFNSPSTLCHPEPSLAHHEAVILSGAARVLCELRSRRTPTKLAPPQPPALLPHVTRCYTRPRARHAHRLHLHPCSTTGTLYIGVTSDLYTRIQQHRQGTFEGFSKTYGCTRLLYYEQFVDIRAAIARESNSKGWRRERSSI